VSIDWLKSRALVRRAAGRAPGATMVPLSPWRGSVPGRLCGRASTCFRLVFARSPSVASISAGQAAQSPRGGSRASLSPYQTLPQRPIAWLGPRPAHAARPPRPSLCHHFPRLFERVLLPSARRTGCRTHRCTEPAAPGRVVAERHPLPSPFEVSSCRPGPSPSPPSGGATCSLGGLAANQAASACEAGPAPEGAASSAAGA
jgi:hypothetical protein